MSRFNQEIGALQGEITKLEVQKKRKDRINVHLDYQYAFSCHIDFVFEYKLEKGKTLTVEDVKGLVEADDVRMAYLYGLKIALTRSISVAGCRKKLLQLEFSEEAAALAIEKLLENHFLDDERYALNYYEMKQSVFGRHRIQQELIRQGVSREVVNRAVQMMANEAQELEEALRFARRKIEEGQAMDQKTYARVYGFLARKGYGGSTIRQVLDQLRSQSLKPGTIDEEGAEVAAFDLDADE